MGKNQKWRCNECETRFRPSIRGGISGRKRLILTAVVSCLFFLFIFHGLLTTHPKVWVKQQIVAVYKFAYGDEHKVKMHEQLGFLYDDLGDEMDDYQGHDF
ncbi:MAG: hypothetical protein JXR97_09320 [Planctomycetes bacterium]|nr:hypothetical protein [Planctomycetota bacterium]